MTIPRRGMDIPEQCQPEGDPFRPLAIISIPCLESEVTCWRWCLNPATGSSQKRIPPKGYPINWNHVNLGNASGQIWTRLLAHGYYCYLFMRNRTRSNSGCCGFSQRKVCDRITTEPCNGNDARSRLRRITQPSGLDSTHRTRAASSANARIGGSQIGNTASR